MNGKTGINRFTFLNIVTNSLADQKSPLVGMKWMFKHQYFQLFGLTERIKIFPKIEDI